MQSLINPLATHLLVRATEISLKGKNRGEFEKILMNNLSKSVGNFDAVKRMHDRILIDLEMTDRSSDLIKKLTQLGGVAGVAPCKIAGLEKDQLSQLASDWVTEDLKSAQNVQHFSVRTKRVNKQLSFTSKEMDISITTLIAAQHPQLRLKLKDPDFKLSVELRNKASLIYSLEWKGERGLPQDRSQRVVCLLSGGIDSPVAVSEIIKRGCTPILVHFHSVPYTSELSIQKVMKLAKTLKQSCPSPIELWLIPFLSVQRKIRDSSNHRYLTILYRRFMFRIAEEIAQRKGALAIATGESIGQVASQTLSNLNAIESSTKLCVLRPLICTDKETIIKKAKALGSYEISLEPHDDACVTFVTARPTTQASNVVLSEDESRLNVHELVFEALDAAKRVWIE